MTAVSTSTQSLPPVTESAPPKADNAVDAGNFLALLNVGTVNAQENISAAPSSDAPRRTSPRDDARDNASDQRPASAPRNNNDNDTTRVANQLPPLREAVAPRPQASDTTPKPEKPATAKPASDTKSATAVNDKGETTQSADNAQDADTAARQKKIREQLSDQLGDISQILQALIAALSNAQPSGAQTTAPGETTIPAASTSTAPDLAALAALLAAPPETTAESETVTATADAATGQPAIPVSSTATLVIPAGLQNTADSKTDLDLLKNLQSLLQKLQDSVQAVDPSPTPSVTATTAQNTPTPVITQAAPQAPATNLQAIAETVQQGVTALAQRFAATQATDDAKPEDSAPLSLPAGATVTTETTTAPVKPENLFAALKERIAQVRDRLQSLNNENETVYAQAKTALQQQFEAAQASYKDSVTAQALADASGQAPIAAAASTAAAPANAIPNTPSYFTAPPVAIVIAASTVENGTDSQTGQQQNQQQGEQRPAAITPASAGQAASTDTTGRSQAPSFARALSHATISLPLQEQVAFQVKTAISDGTSRIRIQLDPADLGKMDIKLTVDADGKTGVSIMVDSKSTLDLLQRDASSLTRALNDAGLSADSSSLSFNLRGGQQEGQQHNEQASSTYKKAQPEEDEQPILGVTSRNYVVNLAEGLDIQI